MLDTLVSAMATAEGWFDPKATVAPRRNNNPINLEFASQEGAVKSGRFAKFDEPGIGTAAAYRQVAKWIQEGKSLRQLISRHAPPNENATESYIRETARRCGIANVDQPLHELLVLTKLP